MNTSFKFVAYCVGVVVIAAGSSIAQAQLVALWDFEEGTGSTTSDQINMNDDPLTDTTWITGPGSLPPVPGGTTAALLFNGTSSVIDTAFEGIVGNNPRTIAMWVNLTEVTDAAASQSLVTYGARDANGRKWHVRINDGGGARVPGAIRTEAQGGNQTGTTNLADGNWHHLASVFPGGIDSNNIDVIHYIDGILEGETGTTDEPIDSGIGGDFPLVSIGARRQGGNSMFDSELSSFLNGTLDDVRIYNVALSQSESQSLVPEPSTASLAAILSIFGIFAGRVRRLRTG